MSVALKDFLWLVDVLPNYQIDTINSMGDPQSPKISFKTNTSEAFTTGKNYTSSTIFGNFLHYLHSQSSNFMSM